MKFGFEQVIKKKDKSFSFSQEIGSSVEVNATNNVIIITN